jgi:hypothetical protein
LLARTGQHLPGAVDLVVCAPLAACLATAAAVCAALAAPRADGSSRATPAVRVDPKFTATAVVSKATGQTLDQRRDAQQPCRKGSAAAGLVAAFGTARARARATGVAAQHEMQGEGEAAAAEEEVEADGCPRAGDLRYPRPRAAALAARGWDWAPLTGGGAATWRQSSHAERRPGWFHPQRLEGARCDDALQSLAFAVPQRLLVVAPADALCRLLGVPLALLEPSTAAAAGHVGASSSSRSSQKVKASPQSRGLVRRQVGPEYAWATPFVLVGGRATEPALVQALLAPAPRELSSHEAAGADSGGGGSAPAAAAAAMAAASLVAVLRGARGFLGWAVHFEHDDNGAPPLPGLPADDDPFLLAAATGAATDAGSDDDEGYESFGRTFEVKGVLHLTWASAGHAEECHRNLALAHALHALLSPLTAKAGSPAAREAAAYAQAVAAALPGVAALSAADAAAPLLQPPKAKGQYCAQVDKWPPCLPGQGAALLPGGSRGGCAGQATLFVRLRFRSPAHAQQGRKLYRDLLLDPLASGSLGWAGFVQCWFEVDEIVALGCRVTLLFASAKLRDQCFEAFNEVMAQPLAPLSKPGSLSVGKGRTAAPNTLPDPTERGLYDDGAFGMH